ncbi:NAD-dependent epimerase/dehydratase family protein [Streptomyces apocyni]|uniref:NAD-dependent epimerase/dehydratase family protein n=1 Tax=Streptomyces apocyni TaxID=2654677 RepID=UPI0012E9C098|nr:NAD-dependent epimerase/dehydratase family protein [Streptomyces apocyni]
MSEICVIGGSRYFGKRLIRQLYDAGHQVSVVNRGSTAPPPGVTHLVADRNDEAALATAIGSRTFDVVLDQVCYTPVQAAIAARVFGGRAGRYVMTSTIEVYDPATLTEPAAAGAVRPTAVDAPVPETMVDPLSWPVRSELPWTDENFLAAHYAEGKRQSEAVFARESGLPFVSVRSTHVLGGGAEEFTGRLDHYVQRVLKGEEIAVHAETVPTVFTHHREIADVLQWAAGAEFTGPVNACSHGPVEVRELCELIAGQVGREPVYRIDGANASPFSYDRHYAMSNARGEELGFSFSHTADWLPEAVAEALAA